MISSLDSVSDWPERAAAVRFKAGKLAQSCGVSLRQLERYFTRTFNHTPQSWLNRKRLEVSRQLLCTQNRQVKEIAWELGYCSASHFVASFRRFYGLTPTAFTLSLRLDLVSNEPKSPDNSQTLTFISQASFSKTKRSQCSEEFTGSI